MRNFWKTWLALSLLLAVSLTGTAFAQEAPAATVAPEAIAYSAPAETETPAPAVIDSFETEQPQAQPASEDTAAVAEEPAPTAEATLDPAGQATTEPTEEPALEATEEPAVTPEPDAEPTEAAPEPAARGVSIDMRVPAQLQLGDTVTLVATLYGYENVSVALQWQYTRDGSNWYDAAGATALTYAFAVSEETAGTAWRLAVTVL
ncbi:MAG: hypothetical protein GX418_11550 [Clostridiales bacterium]|nr:hypothetical protein [Clostridiales bacterium]